MPYTRKKIKAGTLLFRKVISDFKKELNKVKEKGKGKVVKGFFSLSFDGVRDHKDNTKRKALSLRKRKRTIIIH